jgi:hypothetical protein
VLQQPAQAHESPACGCRAVTVGYVDVCGYVGGLSWSQPNGRAESSNDEEEGEAAARPGARLVGVAAVHALTVLRRRGLSTAAEAVAEAARRDERRQPPGHHFPTLARVQLPRDQAMRVCACFSVSRRFAFV